MASLLIAIIYLAFISLGLPDGLLGAAWPSMYQQLSVPLSAAGAVSVTIAAGTIVSSLLSDRLTCKLGTAKVTAISVGMTCLALFGFSFSSAYWMLLVWAVPYGLGAGGVDAALNNYVALHYSSRHMSWLHCMWGIGAATGPYVMGFALTHGAGAWQNGYRYVGFVQILLTLTLILSIPIWKARPLVETAEGEKTDAKPMPLKDVVRVPGVPAVLVTFFCYCAIEATTGLWAASYLNLTKGVDAKTAASLASLFYIGITVGRAINGFLTVKFSDTTLIRAGQGLILIGIIVMVLPGPVAITFAGIILVGLGCAPIYPCIIHSTPAHFGKEKSQAIVGVQMASAYVGTLAAPPIFGLLGQNISMILLPFFLLAILVLMAICHERVAKIGE